MSLKPLKTNEMQLLYEVIEKLRPDLIHILDVLGTRVLTTDERDELRSAIVDELVITGMDSEDDVNRRGELLEDLIDRLGNL